MSHKSENTKNNTKDSQHSCGIMNEKKVASGRTHFSFLNKKNIENKIHNITTTNL